MTHSNERIILHKVGLLNLAEELGNVSKACKTMSVSRDAFYRYREAVESGEWMHWLTVLAVSRMPKTGSIQKQSRSLLPMPLRSRLMDRFLIQ